MYMQALKDMQAHICSVIFMNVVVRSLLFFVSVLCLLFLFCLGVHSFSMYLLLESLLCLCFFSFFLVFCLALSF